jgi:alkylhydroperoxidase/carboxymuconolactone decarboxylase family protein YurZ
VQAARAPARARETRSAAPSRTEPSGDDRGEPPPALVTPSAFAIASERSPPVPANERVSAVSRARVEPPADQIDAFRKILDRVHEERPELAARLSHAAILELSASELVLGFEPGSIFGSEAMPKGSLELVNLAISAHFGQELRLKIETDSARAAGIKTLAVLDTEATERQQRELLSGARRHRGITDAEEVLGARLKDLKLAQR